ncbi:MAG: DUF3365 domain-containing protein [Singulisphaera sp.]
MLLRTRALLIPVALVAVVSAGSLLPAYATDQNEKDPAAERARQTTRMLDDLYKTAVVLITQHYVEVDSDLPAGTAAIALFDAMKKKGWHEVRLLDATGQPIEQKNAAQDEFELEAVKQLLAGKTWHEEIVVRDGQRYLRAATPVPVVLEKCTMCHDHYKQAKPGQPIGALSYTLRIE